MGSQRYAMIWADSNIVANVIVWDGATPYTPPAGTSLVGPLDEETLVGPDWIYDPETGGFLEETA